MMKRTSAAGHWEGEPFKSKMVMTTVSYEEKLDVGLPDFNFNIQLYIDDQAQEFGLSIQYDKKTKGSRRLAYCGCCWGFYTKL
jgi:hypothetical protein